MSLGSNPFGLYQFPTRSGGQEFRHERGHRPDPAMLAGSLQSPSCGWRTPDQPGPD